MVLPVTLGAQLFLGHCLHLSPINIGYYDVAHLLTSVASAYLTVLGVNQFTAPAAVAHISVHLAEGGAATAAAAGANLAFKAGREVCMSLCRFISS